MNNIHDEVLSELSNLVNTGDVKKLRARTYEFVPVAPPKTYTPEQIKALRRRICYTQSYFSKVLGVSIKTVQAWETGTNKPNGTALRMFQILEKDPRALEAYIAANV